MIRVALCFAALLSCALHWKAPSARQRIAALSLVALLAVDVSRPFLTSSRTLYAACFVAFYALTTWAVESLLAPERPRTGQAFALLGAASWLAVRHGATAELGRAAYALSLAAQALAVVRFVSRGRVPDDAQRVALILAASSLADIAGPWLLGEPTRDWFVGRWPAVITWTVVAGWEVRCLIRARL